MGLGAGLAGSLVSGVGLGWSLRGFMRAEMITTVTDWINVITATAMGTQLAVLVILWLRMRRDF